MEKMTTRNLITIGMISAVVGVFFTFLDSMYTALSGVFGTYYLAIVYGVYVISALLPAFIIRKPGAALLGSLIAAGINILTGSPYGINILVAGALQGVGAEAAFAMFKYKKYGILQFFIAAVLMTFLVLIRDWFVFGYSQLPMDVVLTTALIRIVSATVLGYIISFLVGSALFKTGLAQKDED